MSEFSDTQVFNNKDTDVYNKKIKAVPTEEVNIGVDTKNTVLNNIVGEGVNSILNIGEIQSFDQIAQTRDRLYTIFDSMSEDSTIASVLETYASDTTESNDHGKIVWAESSNPVVLKFVEFLLDTMNVDKYIYKWAYSLIKYGDVYLRLYRVSDMQDSLFDNNKKDLNEELNKEYREIEKNILKEDINIKAYKDSDTFTHYVEMVQNPANVFELTKFGKTYAYIKTNINPTPQTAEAYKDMQLYNYSFNKNDIDIYQPTEFVHGCLNDGVSRVEEKVDIYLDDTGIESNKLSYTVRRGQSILYNVFKIWRQIQLLEASLMLNRVSKSSTVRVIQVEVGDMPKENVKNHMINIKQMFEQHAAIDSNNMMSEYTNPSPIENTIYVPTHGGVGSLSTLDLSSNPDPGSLTDIDYFKDKLWAALRAPKQFFADTGDSAGFSGGESLAIISSRYGKEIKKIQNVLRQMITDAINIMLLNKKLKSYINKFEIKMQIPTTKEEIDRREANTNKIRLVSDTMDLVNNIEDDTIKLKILKTLLSDVLDNTEVVALIQEQIDDIESNEENGEDINSEPMNFSSSNPENEEPRDIGSRISQETESDISDFENEISLQTPNESSNELSGSEVILPTPAELDMGDFSENQ